MIEARRGTRTSTAAVPGNGSPSRSDASSAWGANFWVTIRDPQTQALFYACPATGECTWDAPEGHFVLPPNTDGEWWELSDESRGGLPYFYHTKTQETQWTRPEGFVIPLGMIQNTTIGKRLSQTTFGRQSVSMPSTSTAGEAERSEPPLTTERPLKSVPETQEPPQLPARPAIRTRHSLGDAKTAAPRRPVRANGHSLSPLSKTPDASPVETASPTEIPKPPSPTSSGAKRPPALRSSSSSQSVHRPTPPLLNLDFAAELLSASPPSSSRPSPPSAVKSQSPTQPRPAILRQSSTAPSTPTIGETIPAFPAVPVNAGQPSSPLSNGVPSPVLERDKAYPSPRRPIPDVPRSASPHILPRSVSPHNLLKLGSRKRSVTLTSLKSISLPTPSDDSKSQPSPLRPLARPLLIEPPMAIPTRRLSTGAHHVLPEALAADIKRFAASDYAQKFFSTHKKGFLIRRKIPVVEMMKWQKASLTTSLLVMNSSLHKDAVNAFKVIQRVMGDRERDKPVGVRGYKSSSGSTSTTSTASMASLRSPASLLEEERWLLEAGVLHTELRDEIYCQLIKQLSENPSPESAFRGWQLLCVLVITFPPSKYFKDHLKSFLESRVNQKEGKIDVIAKYCLRRLDVVLWKGPRGKAPSCDEIEVAMDAAFNPSVFGEPLVAIYRLQLRTYPESKVPIILPFLCDGILAFGGRKEEGIFRIPGDQDIVSELRLRIDRGHYHLERIEDCHVLASLFKSWLRELQEPVIPDELYNDSLEAAEDVEKTIGIVRRLPDINRRVILHVISFLQLFTPESVTNVTKMTPENLARVMTPNLLRARTNSLDVAFRNNHFENLFVLQLIKHLDCNTIDHDYKPVHGHAAPPPSRTTTTRRPRG